MDYLKKIERNIIDSYPDITEYELHYRMALIYHMIAMNRHKNETFRKEYPHHVG